MAFVGIGVDLLEVERMRRSMERHPRILERVFTEEERAYCDATARPAQHYAARFAAREAVLKALGTGFSQGIGFKDVSVTRAEDGRPRAVLRGRAAEAAGERGVTEVALSLSYTHELAMANAVALTDDTRPKAQERQDAAAALAASFKAARSLLDELEREPAGDAGTDEGREERLHAAGS